MEIDRDSVSLPFRSRMIRTLIISSDFTFLATFARLLKTRFPFIIIEAAKDREEAIRKIRSFKPGLIFIDISLTGKCGFDLTSRIKGLFLGVIIIILMDYDIPEYYEAARKSGADYFFAKQSVNVIEILDLMESILGSGKET